MTALFLLYGWVVKQQGRKPHAGLKNVDFGLTYKYVVVALMLQVSAKRLPIEDQNSKHGLNIDKNSAELNGYWCNIVVQHSLII